MSQHTITLQWIRNTPDFNYSSYSRNHIIKYGEGSTICASSAPEYYGDPKCLDPEQAFVMSVSSCHMLTFLALTSKKGYIVDKYLDNAFGELGKNNLGKTAMVKIELSPEVYFSGENLPSLEKYFDLHTQAHKACFIANSIASCVKVIVNPKMVINK
jgi:organic hydroperoxide reductase OsmC/OhrA